MKTRITIISFIFSHFLGLSQGFLNLKFESASIVPDNSQGNPFIYASNAIPYWAVYFAGSSQVDISYDSIAFDSPNVSIHDTNSIFFAPIQGRYSLYLQGGSPFSFDKGGISITQTGQIPVTAQSIFYWGGALAGSFNGQTLTFNAVGSGTGYTIWQADISSFAGQTGQLMFTAPWQTDGLLDNIQFSSTAVPEPSSLALMAVGAAWLASLRRRKF